MSNFSPDEFYGKIRGILEHIGDLDWGFNVEKVRGKTITPSTRLEEDLGMDRAVRSLFSCEMEDNFGVMVPTKEMVNFKTVGEYYQYIKANKR
jgi:acyl carrier protein